MRALVDTKDVRTVVIDSLNGYQEAMPEEQFLILHIHELLQYLNRQSVTTFLTVAQHGLVGDMKSPVDVTYLADTVVLLRYFEALGRVRRAISIIKKRAGAHEDTIREYRITDRGIKIGQPLQQFQGILWGIPNFVGGDDEIAALGRLRRLNQIRYGSERVVIFASLGRDAIVARSVLAEAGMDGEICRDLPALTQAIAAGAGVALVTDEAIRHGDLQPLAAWIEDQPSWSDFPFVLLTIRGGGMERNPAAQRLVGVLGNVTFLERPFHPMTLISTVSTALRGRRRQYEARARLEVGPRRRRPLAAGASGRPPGLVGA